MCCKHSRTEMDVMATTPRRIADLFCPEISISELNTIRQRVHSTVVLGMGTNSSAHAASLENEDKEIPVASRAGRSEVEQVCYWFYYTGQFDALVSYQFHCCTPIHSVSKVRDLRQ